MKRLRRYELINPKDISTTVLDNNGKEVKKKISKRNIDIWNDFKRNQADFIKNYLPRKVYKGETKFKDLTTDFSSYYYLPTEDQWSVSASGADFSGSWSQYEWLAERRIGIGAKVTRFPADDAIREGFKFLDAETKEVVPRKDIDQFLEDTDLMNELARVIYFERVYGIGFLISYYTKDDKKNELLDKPLTGKKKPVAFEALPPTHLTPINAYESDKLDMNPQNWKLLGGTYGAYEIHEDRSRVFISRPAINRWYGLSIFELIWDHIIPYYQSQIYLLRGFSKWGNTVVDLDFDDNDDLDALYDKHATVIEEMKMNGTYVHQKGTTLKFNNTQLGAGIQELIEVWIEGISAGTGIPVPILMGRVTAAGLSGAAYLMAERYYWNMIKNIQRTFTDDVRAILEKAGFNLDGLIIDWNLAITKTDQQRLVDEGLQIENEIMKEQYVQAQIQTLMMLNQAQNPQENSNNPNENNNNPNGIDENPLDNNPKDKETKNKNKIEKEINKKKNEAPKEQKEDFYTQTKDLFVELRKKRVDFLKRYTKELSKRESDYRN